jgi:hypothetical protein
VLAIDKRAESTLSGVFWTSGRWRQERVKPNLEEERHARDMGYLFDPVEMDHDELVHRTFELAALTDTQTASEAFLASLSTRWRFLRPFLSSAVLAMSMQRHSFTASGRRRPGLYDGGGEDACAICGQREQTATIDLNVLNFERHKWGGVRFLQLPFVWFCLDRLQVEGSAIPSGDDVTLLSSILANLKGLPGNTTLTSSESALRGLKSNQAERHAVLQILSTVSILQNPDHVGFLDAFVNAADRLLPDKHFQERGYPGEWWSASCGVNDAATLRIFPQLAP